METCLIPETAPFAEHEIDLLNRVVGPASAAQRAWLSGFLAGLEAAHGSSQTTARSRPAEPLTIVYATESGNSERLALEAARLARKLGMKPVVVDMAELDLAAIAGAKRLIAIAATWGEGEPPARAAAAYQQLMAEAAPRLDGVKFGVLALGDSAYADFCATGKAIDARLAALGAQRIADRLDCDLDFAEPAARWIEKTLKALAPTSAEERGRVITGDFRGKAAKAVDAGPLEAEIIEHINLNSSRSEKQTVHVELAFNGGAPPYEPGDSLEIYAENDAGYIDELLAAAGLAADGALRADLGRNRDVTTLSLKTVDTFAAMTGRNVADVVGPVDVREWVAGRQLIDLLQLSPVTLTASQLVELTRPLAPRAYSIASSRREVGDEAHLLISAVRYESFGRARKGVASCHVADRLGKGERLRVRLRRSRHFSLPDPARDIIMVGPGTGVAPFRAFVQERRAVGAAGRSWLFFGDRSFTHDFLYQLEWQEALKDGSLTRMDVAFSRDGPRKVYVQDRLWEKRCDVIDWLENGAVFYVCGDAKAMARDLRAALVRSYVDVKALSTAAAEAAVQSLLQSGRYQQDVY